MLHKQIVFAAIAVTALMGLIVPLTVPAAQAQVDTQGIIDDALAGVFGDGNGDGGDDGGDEQGDDNQNIDQENEQEQEAEQEVEQNNDQSETNTQSNELNTGDNTATVTQANAAEQAVEAAAAAESGDAEAEAEDEDDGKDKKHHYSGDSDSTSADAESIATATAEATGLIDQDNVAAVEQDSSANDNVLANVNEFGDDENTQVAVPIIDQDQTAENRAANIDIDEEYGNVVDGDGGDGGDGADEDLRACLLLPPGQIRACVEAL